MILGESFNGRTRDSGSRYVGSIPTFPTGALSNGNAIDFGSMRIGSILSGPIQTKTSEDDV